MPFKGNDNLFSISSEKDAPTAFDRWTGKRDPNSEESANDDDLSAWYYGLWDLYPFPDGSMNPFRKGPPKAGKVLAVVSHDSINRAFNRFIETSLDADTSWVLDLPRRLYSGAVFSAEALISSDGTAAIRYPESAITNMFLLNELLFELRLKRSTRLAEPVAIELLGSLPELLAVFLGGCAPCQPETRQRAVKVLSEARYARRRDRDYAQYQLWSTTIIQQAFLLLHEFAHVIDQDRRPSTQSELTIAHFEGASEEEEIQADRWAIHRLSQLSVAWFDGPTEWVATPLRDLFLVLGLVASKGYIANTPASYLSRLAAILDEFKTANVPLTRATNENRWLAGLLLDTAAYRGLVPLRRPHKVLDEVDGSFSSVVTRYQEPRFASELKSLTEGVAAMYLQAKHKVGTNPSDLSEHLLKQAGQQWYRYTDLRSGKPDNEMPNEAEVQLVVTAIWSAAAAQPSLKGFPQYESWNANNLATWLRELFLRTHHAFCLELSIDSAKFAATRVDRISPEAADYFLNLGVSLALRYDEFSWSAGHNPSTDFIASLIRHARGDALADARTSTPSTEDALAGERDLAAALHAFEASIESVPSSDEAKRARNLAYLKEMDLRDRSRAFMAMYNVSARWPALTMREGHTV